MNNYIPYHVHTEDSLLDSCTNYKLYVDMAVELGQKAICFTEHGNIFRWCEKKAYVNSKGLKYLHGCEVYLTEQLEPKIRDNYHTILIAKNYNGVKELNTLVGKATDKNHMYYKPRLSFDEFFNISDNIIKISACLASPLSKDPRVFDYEEHNRTILKYQEEQVMELKKCALEYTNEKYEEYLNSCGEEEIPQSKNDWLADGKKRLIKIQKHYQKLIEFENERVSKAKRTYDKLFRTYDYYEIQPHVNSNDQIKYNKLLYKASLHYNKPLIAATDTHSLNKYKAECRSILQKSKRIEFADEDAFDLTYKSYDELVEMFKKQNSLPIDVVLEAIENTNRMADSVEDFQMDLSIKYPKLYDNEGAYS